MKMECDVIRDLLALFAEDMVSEKSRELVEEHLVGCEECSNIYKKMIIPEPQIQNNRNEAKGFQEYVKKEKRHYGWKVGLLTAAAIFGFLLIRFVLITGGIGFLVADSKSAKILEDTNISNYGQYMGADAEKEYLDKWDMDESIFPISITNEMNVKDYKMVYYNPWDAQYLSYIVVNYKDADYKKELERLSDLGIEDYKGYYGAEGFDKNYELVAMNSDKTYGFVYALTDGKGEIIYVEIIFCNYFMDIDYEQYIDKTYLPIGFDAKSNNAYREKMLK